MSQKNSTSGQGELVFGTVGTVNKHDDISGHQQRPCPLSLQKCFSLVGLPQLKHLADGASGNISRFRDSANLVMSASKPPLEFSIGCQGLEAYYPLIAASCLCRNLICFHGFRLRKLSKSLGFECSIGTGLEQPTWTIWRSPGMAMTSAPPIFNEKSTRGFCGMVTRTLEKQGKTGTRGRKVARTGTDTQNSDACR
jgi:hypothetical protein